MNWETTFIVGGGPSAATVDTAPLRRSGVVLGVNDATFHKACDAFFSNDHNYARGILSRLAELPGERHLAVRKRHWHQFTGWPVRLWERVETAEPATRPGVLSSGRVGDPACSGYVALNLAAQQGARRIVLLGYDFHDEYTYFFDDKPFPRVRVPEVRETFRAVAPWYAARGIEVVNANLASAIDAFPRQPLAELLR